VLNTTAVASQSDKAEAAQASEDVLAFYKDEPTERE
jgi:hypothetical protein